MCWGANGWDGNGVGATGDGVRMVFEGIWEQREDGVVALVNGVGMLLHAKRRRGNGVGELGDGRDGVEALEGRSGNGAGALMDRMAMV